MEKKSRELNKISEIKMEESLKSNNVENSSKENLASQVTVKKENLQKNIYENIVELILNDKDKFNKIIFLGNLGEETSVEDVKKLFVKEIGLRDNEILDVSMLWKLKNDSKTLAFTFVEFTNEQAYQTALSLNNSFHFGQNLLVLPSVKTHCGIFIMEKTESECKKDKVECTKNKTESTKDKIESTRGKTECTKDKIECKIDKIECTRDKIDCKKEVTECKKDKTESKKDVVECKKDKIENKKDVVECKKDKIESKKDVVECKKDKIESKKDVIECKKDKIESKKDVVVCKKDKIESTKDVVECKKDKIENTKDVLECKKDVIEIESTISPERNFVPVYKKSDHVAYLKHLPPDVTEDNILQFLNFTRNDVVDISVLKNTRRKSNSKRHELRAVIAFITEENLKKCLSQTCRVFQNHCIEIERHGMSKMASTGEKQSTNSASVDGNERTGSPKKLDPGAACEKEIKNTDKVELDLFVKHINWSASERLIREFFASVGAIVVGMKQFGDSGARARGMGFVTMADKESLLKGLALNGAILLGNKIKVCIRSDRKFLECPIVGEIPPNFSTFVGNLPIKKSAETLKLALADYFKETGCLVQSIYVPLAENHSGNRGYAFVTFQDENSLLKASKLNGTEIQICSNKINVNVSSNWPENSKETFDAVNKSKDYDYRRVSTTSETESSRSGRLHKRKRKVPTSPHRTGISKGYKDTPKKLAMQGSTEYPIKQTQQQIPNYDSYGSEYDAYLDYLEFRDYVAMRKAYDERQVLADYHVRHGGHEEEYLPKQNDSQTYFPTSTQSSYVAKTVRSFQETLPESKEENLDNGWRSYSSAVSSRGGDLGYDHHQLPPVTSASGYEKHSHAPIPTTTRGYENLPQPIMTTSYCGYEKFLPSVNPSSSTVPREKHDLHHVASYPNARDAKVISNSVWSSSTGRYSSGDKASLQTNSQWCASSSQSFWERRDAEAPLQGVGYSNDSSNRGLQGSCFRSNYTSERGHDVYPPQPLTASTTQLSDLRSSALRSGKSDHDLGLYSRIDRRTPSDNVVSVPASSMPYAGETANWVSYPAGTSTLSHSNDPYTYADHSSAKCVDEPRNVCDKSGSFVSKLLTSGILSNAGYNVTTGYHAN